MKCVQVTVMILRISPYSVRLRENTFQKDCKVLAVAFERV